jgi:cytochrome c-type biogenesis protein CcmH
MRSRYSWQAFTLVLALACPTLHAAGTTGDAAFERRVTHLTEELRCLVCQNQTLADSHAELAVDLKNQVREKLAQGQSDQDVLDFMVERYGDFVLYRPPLKGITWVLWFGPFLLLLAGLAILLLKWREKPGPVEALSPTELARAAMLLADAPAPKEKP